MIDEARITVYHWVWCKCLPCVADRMGGTVTELIPLTEWRAMPPKTQGYVWYMQADLPGSELKNERNPYEVGTPAYVAFEDGVQRGILAAQDSEE